LSLKAIGRNLYSDCRGFLKGSLGMTDSLIVIAGRGIGFENEEGIKSRNSKYEQN
jgi:hypothetical protein